MTRPTVEISKVDGGTGVVRPGAVGVLALIAAAASGTLNEAGSYTRRELLEDDHGHGHLLEFGAYVLGETKKPIVAVAGDPATDGAYSSITKSGGGTATFAAGTTKPVDEFDVVIEFTVAGTIGTTGIKYRYSLNGGDDFSKATALGTATSIVIPDTGITVDLVSTETVTTTTKATFTTTGPKITNADLPDALEALRVTSLAFEAVLIDMEADASTVSLVVQWLQSDINPRGKYPVVFLTARKQADNEDATDYREALDTIFAAAEGTDVIVAAEEGDITSLVRGITFARPAGLFAAARTMSVSRGTDPAWVELGPLTGVGIKDERGNPKHHNEALYPGLDDLRLTTLCTIEGFEGVYLTNVNLLSASGSDYVFVQHARTINRGCELAYQVLTKQLSRGVRKEPQAGPGGERYILEAEAQKLEELANAEIHRELVQPGEVDDMRLIVSRTDDIRSNAGATVTCALQSVSLGYIKKFTVTAGFVTAIDTGA